MNRCIILAGGPPSDYDRVTVTAAPEDYIIACDAGYLAAERLGLIPHLVVGDFDSFQGTIPPEIPVLTVPAKKNDTDTALGLKKGLERGYRDFLIIGGFGGRLDHTMANLQLLSFLCQQGAQGSLISNDNRAWAIHNGTLAIPALPRHHISVFAWGGVCQGVTLSGLAYPLTDHTLLPGVPLGVSNEFSAPTAQISVRQGTLLVVASAE